MMHSVCIWRYAHSTCIVLCTQRLSSLPFHDIHQALCIHRVSNASHSSPCIYHFVSSTSHLLRVIVRWICWTDWILPIKPVDWIHSIDGPSEQIADVNNRPVSIHWYPLDPPDSMHLIIFTRSYSLNPIHCIQWVPTSSQEESNLSVLIARWSVSRWTSWIICRDCWN